MSCDKFRCVYECDRECDQMGGECIGDLCEDFGECAACQKLDLEGCDGLQGSKV